jgi:hypothetical protein
MSCFSNNNIYKYIIDIGNTNTQNLLIVINILFMVKGHDLESLLSTNDLKLEEFWPGFCFFVNFIIVFLRRFCSLSHNFLE